MTLSPGQIVSGRHGWTYEVLDASPDEHGRFRLREIGRGTGSVMFHRLDEITAVFDYRPKMTEAA